MKELNIDHRRCIIQEDEHAHRVVVEMIGAHALASIEEEWKQIHQLTATPLIYIGVVIDDWHHDLTPWEGKDPYGDVPFSNGGKETFKWLMNSLLPYLNERYSVESYYLAGYSLAGLFALWCSYQTNVFKGIASGSPSLWYEGWEDYMTHQCLCPHVYLSIGTKEHRVRHQTIRRIRELIEKQYQILNKQGMDVHLELNPGNHFKDEPLRMAKGIAWLLNV